MEKLDTNYLAELVVKAQNGGSNAFAELYTATYKREYAYAYEYLRNEDKAKEALKSTYVRALTEIKKLNEPDLIVPWLFRICFEICQGIKVIELLENGFDINDMSYDEICFDGKSFRVAGILKNLPLTESQVLVMRYFQSYSIGEIAIRLGLKKYEAKNNLSSAKKHIKQLYGD